MEPGRRTAVALVFGSSAAVLVVEIVALRLLAPYLGLTLETSTLVIAIALGSIAFGSWYGGLVADRGRPERWLAPIFLVSGLVVAGTPFAVRLAGEYGAGLVLLVAAVTIMVPGALLSAVTPIVTKLHLATLAETGTVVGRLSGISTVGSIVGTVVTGFVLISVVPVSGILVGLGVALLVVGVLLSPALHRRRRAVGAGAAVVAAAAAAQLGPGQCDAETRYHCAVVVADPAREGGRTLVLDNLRHSYVDLDDPTHLEFAYVRAMAAVVDTTWGGDQPVRAAFLGGGGLTLPRYLAATRPGSDSIVSEIDPGVVEIDRTALGLDEVDGAVEVRVEDGRRGLARQETDSRDLVVGDAFGGVTVPWHLTTIEAVRQVDRVLSEDGVYVLNLIDYGPLDFARAEVATLGTAFEHVAVSADPTDLDTVADELDGGNLVAIASDAPLDAERVQRALDAEEGLGWQVIDGPEVDRWVGGADVLTDDHAPVDQLITQSPY